MARKVLIDYTKLKDAELNEFTDHVIAEMTGNADFPSPPWSMGQLQNVKISFLQAVEKAQEGGNQETVDKNNKRKILEDYHRDIATYVNLTAKGDELKLAGSGYTLTDPPTPVGVLPAPENVKVETNNIPKQLEVNQTRQEKAEIYIVLYTDQDPAPENDEDWTRVEDRASKILIENLTSGQKYWVKAGARATEDKVLYSPMQSVYVQ